jgi:hypothetical protein
MASFCANSASSASLSNAGSFKEYKDIKINIKKGDLIEIFRFEKELQIYRHWVIFEKKDERGNLWCFHVSGAVGEDNSAEEVVSNGKAQIRYEPLTIILRDNDSGEESLLRVNNQKRMAEAMLKAAKIEMPKIEDVFSMLHKLKDAIVKYDIKKSNCEHYVTLWKYGIGWSSQVNGVKDIIQFTLKTTSKLLMAAGIGLIKHKEFSTGGLCIIISAVLSKASKAIKNIELTMEETLIIEYPERDDESKYLNSKNLLISLVLLIAIIIIIYTYSLY